MIYPSQSNSFAQCAQSNVINIIFDLCIFNTKGKNFANITLNQKNLINKNSSLTKLLQML